MNLTLEQRLVLHKWLTDKLKALREDDLLPEASAELVSGERHSVKFGKEVAAWVNMPQPSTSVNVTDDAKLLAWCEENAPHAIATVTEVETSSALIRYLREHAPEFLRETRKVDADWIEDQKTGLKNKGFIVTYQGEKITEVPGITIRQGDAVPRVSLTDSASSVIGKAWRDGDIQLSGLLALPAAEDGDA